MALEPARPDRRARTTAVARLGATLAVAGALLTAAPPAGAATGDVTTCHDAAIARQRTEIDADATVPQFDGALGTLLEVTVPVQSVHLDTDASFENVAATPVTFAEQMSHSVTFTSPAGLPSPAPVSGTLARIPTQVLAAFDGTLDYVGRERRHPAVDRARRHRGARGLHRPGGARGLHRFRDDAVPRHDLDQRDVHRRRRQRAGRRSTPTPRPPCRSATGTSRVGPSVPPPTTPTAIEVAGASVPRTPTLPETGATTLPSRWGAQRRSRSDRCSYGVSEPQRRPCWAESVPSSRSLLLRSRLASVA